MKTSEFRALLADCLRTFAPHIDPAAVTFTADTSTAAIYIRCPADLTAAERASIRAELRSVVPFGIHIKMGSAPAQHLN